MSTEIALVELTHTTFAETIEDGESYHIATFGYPTVRADNDMLTE
jgi:hypothetical protein